MVTADGEPVWPVDLGEVRLWPMEGDDGPLRNVVLFNAGAALFIAGHSASVREGIGAAAQCIDSGAARSTLERLVAVSNGSQAA